MVPAILVGAFTNVIFPMIRSMMSKIVGPERQGMLFAAVFGLEAIFDLISGVLMNAIYTATVAIYPGICFFISAGFFLISTLLLWFVVLPVISILMLRSISTLECFICGYNKSHCQLHNSQTFFTQHLKNTSLYIVSSMRNLFIYKLCLDANELKVQKIQNSIRDARTPQPREIFSTP